MGVKVKKTQKRLEKEAERDKIETNLEWNDYMKYMDNGFFDQELLVLFMQKMQNIDYRLLELKRRDLLG